MRRGACSGSSGEGRPWLGGDEVSLRRLEGLLKQCWAVSWCCFVLDVRFKRVWEAVMACLFLYFLRFFAGLYTFRRVSGRDLGRQDRCRVPRSVRKSGAARSARSMR